MEDRKYKHWVFTLNEDIDDMEDNFEDKLESFLKTFCKTYVFQKEKGEKTQRTHLQGYFQTIVRKRHPTLLSMFKILMLESHTNISSLTLERMMGTQEEARAYCTKTDTRIGQPRSFGFLMPYEASDLKLFLNKDSWYPWQRELSEILFQSELGKVPIKIKDADDRTLIWIFDQYGCSGKSKFVKHVCFNEQENTCKLAFGSSTQLRSACISAGPRQLYFIDLPRTLGRDDNIYDIISTAEDIKNGFLVTSMYGLYKSLIFEPPHVVIFSNTLPPKDSMSHDRWQVYRMMLGNYLEKDI